MHGIFTGENYLKEQFETTHRREFSYTSDYVFKAVFGQDSEESKQALISFLNIILAAGDDPITSIKILNPIVIGKSAEQKQSVMDLLAETEKNQLLNIEMQSGHFAYYSNRSLKYGGKLLERSLSKGEDYGTMKKSIVITVANGRIYRNSDKLHCRFVLREDDTGEIMSDRLEFHCIQLGAVDISKPVEKLSPEEIFAAYLKFAGDEYRTDYVSELLNRGGEYIEMAEHVFRGLTLDERALLEKDAYEIAMTDRISQLAELKALKTETEALKTETEALKTETEALKTETEALKTETEALKTEVERREAAVEIEKTAVEAEKAAVNARETEIRNREAAIEAREESVDAREAAVNVREAEIEADNAKLKAEIEALKKELAGQNTQR